MRHANHTWREMWSTRPRSSQREAQQLGQERKPKFLAGRQFKGCLSKLNQMTQNSMRTFFKKKRTKELEIRAESAMPCKVARNSVAKTLKHLQATEQLCLDGSNANGLWVSSCKEVLRTTMPQDIVCDSERMPVTRSGCPMLAFGSQGIRISSSGWEDAWRSY